MNVVVLTESTYTKVKSMIYLHEPHLPLKWAVLENDLQIISNPHK